MILLVAEESGVEILPDTTILTPVCEDGDIGVFDGTVGERAVMGVCLKGAAEREYVQFLCMGPPIRRMTVELLYKIVAWCIMAYIYSYNLSVWGGVVLVIFGMMVFVQLDMIVRKTAGRERVRRALRAMPHPVAARIAATTLEKKV